MIEEVMYEVVVRRIGTKTHEATARVTADLVTALGEKWRDALAVEVSHALTAVEDAARAEAA